jgi:hypothetical protein
VLGINIELVVDPITMQLAQGIAKLSFNITLGVRLFCGEVQRFEDFTLCDLQKFDVIFREHIFGCLESRHPLQ